MFGISSFEFLMILLIGVVVLGPEKLPRIMRTFNKFMSEFRRIRTELHRTVNLEIANQEHEERKREAEAELLQKEQPGAAAEFAAISDAASADAASEPLLSRPKTDSLHVNMEDFQAQAQPGTAADEPQAYSEAQPEPTPESTVDGVIQADPGTDGTENQAEKKAQS